MVEPSPSELRNESSNAESRKSQLRNSGSSAGSTSEASLVSGPNLTQESASESSSPLPGDDQLESRPPPLAQSGRDSSLSSADEFQSARIDIQDEEDDETVSKIQIEHSNQLRGDQRQSSKSAQSSPLIATTLRLQRQQQPRLVMQPSNSPLAKQRHFKSQVQHDRTMSMPRSHTSPSPLSQLARWTPRLARNTRGTTSNGDSGSQISLHYKYQGSNHFEIRWQNLSLYARPKRRLTRMVTDCSLYRALFGSDGSSETASERAAGDAYFGSHKRPPVSPLMHKIPPTIDENLEMRCPSTPPISSEGKQVAPWDIPGGVGGALQQAPQQQQVATGRCILDNISGQVFSGQMTAILGPSGVGKTSLLNSLTGRNTLDGTGRVSLIGALHCKRMSVVTVPQNDVLPSKLTTLEDLQFTSRLKNPEMANPDHKRNIERIVKHLHMDKFLHTRIEKLSGGEARRLSIARELLSSPDIMILDEPTSGLDANTCKKIVSALRDIVEHSDNILDKPMSLIITIHQPQQEVFQLFHRVHVMAQGGRVIYEGSPQLLMPTLCEFSSVQRVASEHQVALNENPAIVAIEVASGEFGQEVIDELARHHEAQIYEELLAFGVGSPLVSGRASNSASPSLTPISLRQYHKSPHSGARFELHRRRLNSLGELSLGRATPKLAKRTNGAEKPAQPQYQQQPVQWDRISQVTSCSYASTYDAELPPETSKLKVDKRLRRSVVMKSHFLSHTLTLIQRCWLLTTRDLFLMSIRIFGFLMVAGGIVQIFASALDPDEHLCPMFETEIDDMPQYMHQVRQRLTGLFNMLRQSNSTHLFFFYLLLCITMVPSALAGLVFPLQIRMFIREHKNGWYSPGAFITSQTIAELPADVVGPLITLLIAYPLCHQPDSLYHWRLIGYCLTVILAAIICKSQAQIVGAFLMDSVENSVFMSCVAVTPHALLSGCPLRVSQLIQPLQWASYGSFLRYAFESLLELRYGFGMCPCDSTLVNGPLRAGSDAVPAHLESLATGLLELHLPARPSNISGGLGQRPVMNSGDQGEIVATTTTLLVTGSSENENLFIKFLKLISDAGNLFTTQAEFSDCSGYRSLYMIIMGIKNNTFTWWLPVMFLMFIISRFLTYFAVRTVIKIRHRSG